MDLPFAAVRTVLHQIMTAQPPTMTAAAWIVQRLRVETISAAVRTVPH